MGTWKTSLVSKKQGPVRENGETAMPKTFKTLNIVSVLNPLNDESLLYETIGLIIWMMIGAISVYIGSQI